ncbi:MAG: hypothetical protein AB1331_02400 [Bacillota bacterium]
MKDRPARIIDQQAATPAAVLLTSLAWGLLAVAIGWVFVALGWWLLGQLWYRELLVPHAALQTTRLFLLCVAWAGGVWAFFLAWRRYNCRRRSGRDQRTARAGLRAVNQWPWAEMVWSPRDKAIQYYKRSRLWSPAGDGREPATRLLSRAAVLEREGSLPEAASCLRLVVADGRAPSLLRQTARRDLVRLLPRLGQAGAALARRLKEVEQNHG